MARQSAPIRGAYHRDVHRAANVPACRQKPPAPLSAFGSLLKSGFWGINRTYLCRDDSPAWTARLGQPGLDSPAWTARLGQPGLDSPAWTARLGQPGLDSPAWTARLGQPGLDSPAWTARLGQPGESGVFWQTLTLSATELIFFRNTLRVYIGRCGRNLLLGKAFSKLRLRP